MTRPSELRVSVNPAASKAAILSGSSGNCDNLAGGPEETADGVEVAGPGVLLVRSQPASVLREMMKRSVLILKKQGFCMVGGLTGVSLRGHERTSKSGEMERFLRCEYRFVTRSGRV